MNNSEIQKSFSNPKEKKINSIDISNQKFVSDFSDKLIVKKKLTKMDVIENQLAMTLISTIGICNHVNYK